jgi:hypothetical protein
LRPGKTVRIRVAGAGPLRMPYGFFIREDLDRPYQGATRANVRCSQAQQVQTFSLASSGLPHAVRSAVGRPST